MQLKKIKINKYCNSDNRNVLTKKNFSITYNQFVISGKLFLQVGNTKDYHEDVYRLCHSTRSYLSHMCPLLHTACLRSVKGRTSLHRLQYSGNVCLFIFFIM